MSQWACAGEARFTGAKSLYCTSAAAPVETSEQRGLNCYQLSHGHWPTSLPQQLWTSTSCGSSHTCIRGDSRLQCAEASLGIVNSASTSGVDHMSTLRVPASTTLSSISHGIHRMSPLSQLVAMCVTGSGLADVAGQPDPRMIIPAVLVCSRPAVAPPPLQSNGTTPCSLDNCNQYSCTVAGPSSSACLAAASAATQTLVSAVRSCDSDQLQTGWQDSTTPLPSSVDHAQTQSSATLGTSRSCIPANLHRSDANLAAAMMQASVHRYTNAACWQHTAPVIGAPDSHKQTSSLCRFLPPAQHLTSAAATHSIETCTGLEHTYQVHASQQASALQPMQQQALISQVQQQQQQRRMQAQQVAQQQTSSSFKRSWVTAFGSHPSSSLQRTMDRSMAAAGSRQLKSHPSDMRPPSKAQQQVLQWQQQQQPPPFVAGQQQTQREPYATRPLLSADSLYQHQSAANTYAVNLNRQQQQSYLSECSSFGSADSACSHHTGIVYSQAQLQQEAEVSPVAQALQASVMYSYPARLAAIRFGITISPRLDLGGMESSVAWAAKALCVRCWDCFWLAQVMCRRLQPYRSVLQQYLGPMESSCAVGAVCLWVACKLEGKRKEGLQCRRVAAVVGLPCSQVCTIELQVMECLNWQPYAGYVDAGFN